MSTIDQQFVEYAEDVGRVIGRRGVTAQSIRTLLRALGTKNDARYNLKIVNTDNGEATHSASSTPAPSAEEAPAAEEPAGEYGEDDIEESEASDLADRTRAELAEMDDLDI